MTAGRHTAPTRLLIVKWLVIFWSVVVVTGFGLLYYASYEAVIRAMPTRVAFNSQYQSSLPTPFTDGSIYRLRTADAHAHVLAGGYDEDTKTTRMIRVDGEGRVIVAPTPTPSSSAQATFIAVLDSVPKEGLISRRNQDGNYDRLRVNAPGPLYAYDDTKNAWVEVLVVRK